MKTTFREIFKHKPCGQIKGSGEWWDLLTSKLGTENLDTDVSILEILESNGIQDAVWALRTQKYKDYCLFLADVAESVLHIFEREYPEDDRPRKCVEGVRLFHAGKITKYELKQLRTNVHAPVVYYTADPIGTASIACASAAYAARDTDYDFDRVEKWKEIEVLLRKYI